MKALEKKEYRCGSCLELLFTYNPVVCEIGVEAISHFDTKILEVTCPRCQTKQAITEEFLKRDWSALICGSCS